MGKYPLVVPIEWMPSAYDFANKRRDFIEQTVASMPGVSLVETIARILAGYWTAVLNFEPGPRHSKPTLADNEPLVRLAEVVFYARGGVFAWGMSGGLYQWGAGGTSGVSPEDALCQLDVMRMAGVSEEWLARCANRSPAQFEVDEKKMREAVGEYALEIPDFGAYEPFGYSEKDEDEAGLDQPKTDEEGGLER